MKNLMIAALILFGASASFGRWDLNDVSYLMPLPTSPQVDTLLRMNQSARGGYLLHPAFLNQIPNLTLADRPEDMLATLRVVGVRIDPCFPLPTPQACQKQVRLIWQPVQVDRRQTVQSIDAALHSFYVLNDREFIALLRDIASWKSRHRFSTKGKPLQVHPAWAQHGVESPALIEFQDILRRHIGMYNFFRVTAMFLRGGGNMWAFASFELRNGELAPQPIPRLSGKKSQTFVNLALPSDHFESAGMAPKAQGEDLIDALLELPPTQGPLSEAVIFKSFASLYKMENPRHFNPENLDCVSCHVAQPVKYVYFHKRPELKLSQVAREYQYFNPRYNMKNMSGNPRDSQIIRAFGYFGRDLAISQRVINESAEVADRLNHSLR